MRRRSRSRPGRALWRAGSSGSYGPIDARGAAVLAGRRPHAILRAFPELGPAPLRQARTGRFDAGMSERAIERKRHVGRRTIVKALASADPPERKKIRREPTALTGLHSCIDGMIAADRQITIAAIRERLADEHGAAIAYPTLRTYVTSRRATAKTHGSKVPASRQVKERHAACPSR
jgi:hypothetical protein